MLDGINRLWEAESAAVLYIIRPQVGSLGEGRLMPQQRRLQVKAINSMPYLSGETYGHISPCCGYLQFALIPSRKCTTLPPIELTSAHVVFGLYSNCSNEDAPTGPIVTVLNRWGVTAP